MAIIPTPVPTPVATMSDGRIRYSDGSVKAAASSSSNSNAANYQPAGGNKSFQPYVPTPSPSKGVSGAQAPSGSGGSTQKYGGYQDQAAYDLARALEQERSQSDSLINQAYGASNDYLNQAESALRGDYPTILNEIEAQRAAAQRTAESGKASTLGTINEQQTMATQRNQNVMADARRLYDELTRGYTQRFGGASSAGQAATELGRLEQQRQAGKTQQDFGNTMRQIEQARTQTEQKFQDQLYQLEQVKQQSVNEANRDFQNKLLQISQSRAENEQAKAQARLQALQDLRNKVYQIQLQNLQFQQTLQAQKAQSDQSLSAYSSSLGSFGNMATNAVGGFNPIAQSNLQTGDTGMGQTANPYVGSINNKDESLMGSILPNLRDRGLGGGAW